MSGPVAPQNRPDRQWSCNDCAYLSYEDIYPHCPMPFCENAKTKLVQYPIGFVCPDEPPCEFFELRMPAAA
jgi:hypothetical protein